MPPQSKTRQPRRGDIFVESTTDRLSSSVRSGICSPDGARELGGAGGYKDFAPDGAFGRSAAVFAGSVAEHGWTEAVENILRRGFANVLRLGFATAALRANRNAVAAFSPVAANVSWLKPLRGKIGADSRPLLQAQR